MNSLQHSKSVKPTVFAILLTGASVVLAAQPTTQPIVASSPATQPTVASLLSDIDAAYAKLQSAQFDGQITGHFDVQGKKIDQDSSFTSTFASPNQFRHETKDDALIVSNGKTIYSYLSKRDEYQTADAPKERSASSVWPANITRILVDQNPALLLALSKSAAGELNELSKNVILMTPTLIDGVSYPTIRFDIGTDHQIVTMMFDPATHLLRRVITDFSQPLMKAGTADVKQAMVTIDYSKAQTDAPADAGQFTWAAPAGAALVTAVQPAQVEDDSPDAVKELIGKPAPNFTLKLIDGKTIKLSDLKGSVVILDFWATWCGPCVASLPHLNDLYKELSGQGLKVIAMNLQQDADTVKAFVEKKKWTLPVALDTDGAVAQKYKASAIPETVVIGKDGTVKQVFVGSGNEDAIKALVTKEMQ
jgi:peroxiredoxin/outer membrane lipoprotein-sorting protein